MIGRIRHKMDKGFIGVDWATCCGACCVDTFILGGLVSVYFAYDLRNQIRRRFNVDPHVGDIANCCTALCCTSCVMCQINRELTIRGYWPGSSCCYDDPNPALLAMRTVQMQ